MKIVDSTYLIDLCNGVEGALKKSEEEEFLTTSINMYEVIRGAFLRKKGSEKIKKMIEMFGSLRVLQLDDASVIRSAEISAELRLSGKEIPDADCLIAGIALSNGVNTIITRNKEHFSRIKGIKTEGY